ncbi:hypothetical protein EDB86DRAFT_2832958 [Lactarius hatsudake]|nr:hypothetical protein EDB86DRAFT_2832958 [Lactarius hatsudake]
MAEDLRNFTKTVLTSTLRGRSNQVFDEVRQPSHESIAQGMLNPLDRTTNDQGKPNPSLVVQIPNLTVPTWIIFTQFLIDEVETRHRTACCLAPVRHTVVRIVDEINGSSSSEWIGTNYFCERVSGLYEIGDDRNLRVMALARSCGCASPWVMTKDSHVKFASSVAKCGTNIPLEWDSLEGLPNETYEREFTNGKRTPGDGTVYIVPSLMVIDDPKDELEGEAWSDTLEVPSNPRESAMDNSLDGPAPSEAHSERRDFDDGANALWSLYCKEAQTHDEAHLQSLARDMDGVLVFAGLFSVVLTSFLVQSIQDLRANPAQESAYYQQQSVAMLAQISEQVVSIATLISIPSTPTQSPIPSTPPPPYPQFYPSSSNIRVTVLRVTSLACSLSAALIAIFFQQWARSYMQVFQRYDHPLKRARFRQFFFEGADRMWNLAEAAPRLIHVSVFLFFLGLGDSMLNTNTAVGITTIVLICLGGLFYLYSVSAHLKNMQSPYQTLISRPIFILMQKLLSPYYDSRFLRKRRTPTNIEAYQEELVMEETEERKERDVRAVRWLVDNTTVNAEMEPLVLAIPDTFNTEWGREVWMDVSSQRPSDPDKSGTQTDRSPAGGQHTLTHHSSRFLERTNIYTICRSLCHLFETCNSHSYFANEEARRRRMRACVEAAAALVCCIDFRLDWFGEVCKVVSEIAHIEKINQSPTSASDPSFVIRWTCLSLVVIQQKLSNSRLQVLAGYAVSGLTRIQSDVGQPDEAALKSAQAIDRRLKIAWEYVEDLRKAFEPCGQKRSREQVEKILRDHELHISELERIEVEANGMEDVDWRISLYRDAFDDATCGLTRQLPGVSFDEPHPRFESFLISDTFNPPAACSAPIIPQLIFPGQQVRASARFGSRLREVLDGQVPEGYNDVLESLKSLEKVPFSLRQPNGLMRRQLWRLQDVRDGGGLGVFYIGTFKTITSHWMEGRKSLGTQRILLNIICDLTIRGRGVFSDFSYPESIMTMFVDMVGNIFQGYEGPDEHVRDAVREIESVDTRTCMDTGLRRRALAAILRSGSNQHPGRVVPDS